MADAKRATNLTKPPPRMDQATRAKSLLSLEVKVLTQTLGAENQWDELGDGVVEFNDLTIRVLQPRGAGASTTSSNAAKSSTTNPAAGATNPEGPNVLLEDNISTDTPFVGENCCIVWNSIEQQLSLCLMYASEEGYTASWSALVSLQEKAYPSFRFDLLERCGPDVKENRLPYSYFIHDQYDPPLGFIEQHALSLSVMEHGHSKRPQLYESREVTNALLNLANGDLLEHFLSEEVYPMVAKGLGCAAVPAAWTIPTGLTKLKIPEDMATLIAKDMRLAHMQEDLLPRTASADLITKLVICSHRIRNDLTCMLLSSDDMLVQAKDALLIAPPANSPLRQASHDGSYIVSSRSTESVTEVEQQVLSHLHFFRSLVALSLSELGRDLVGPVILKIYQCGLLEALSLVAERFAMPSGIASMFQMNLQDTKSGSPRKGVSPPASPNYYSPAIEQELTWLLDATIVRINERQEEQLMNEIVRTPVLSQPLKYNGLISFMCRQLVVGSGVKKMLRDGVGIRNPYLLFHALGLHDDEGSAGAERNSDNAVTETRNKFHHFVITKYLVQSMRGSLAMVPPPPASASSTHRGGPIIQFDSANASPLSNSASTLPQGISPPFIKILEYLLLLANSENREGLLKAIFSHKSRVLAFIEDCCTLAITNNKVIGLDVLCSNMRFLRMVVGKLADVQSQEDVGGVSSNTGNNSIFAANHAAAHQAHSNLPKSLSTTAARKLTAERDTFGAVLRAYEALGGSRRQTVFHASVLFLLDTIEKLCTKSDDLSSSLRCVRDFIFFKHLDRLPQQTVTRYREALLTETRMRLGAEEFGNNSVSVLSSTVSEMVHSASRLRFVDEVEAATGGVDGTVVPGTVANLSPAVVASVTSSEDKLAKRRSSRPNIEQWRPNSQPTPKTGEDAGLRANAPKGGEATRTASEYGCDGCASDAILPAIAALRPDIQSSSWKTFLPWYHGGSVWPALRGWHEPIDQHLGGWDEWSGRNWGNE